MVPFKKKRIKVWYSKAQLNPRSPESENPEVLNCCLNLEPSSKTLKPQNSQSSLLLGPVVGSVVAAVFVTVFLLPLVPGGESGSHTVLLAFCWQGVALSKRSARLKAAEYMKRTIARLWY